MIKYRKDLINKACESRTRISPEEMDDFLRCLIEYMEIKVKEDSVPAFELPYVGYIFTSLEGARKSATFSKEKKLPDNHIRRYERVQKMAMSIEYDYITNVFNKDCMFLSYLKHSQLELEEYENMQNNT